MPLSEEIANLSEDGMHDLAEYKLIHGKIGNVEYPELLNQMAYFGTEKDRELLIGMKTLEALSDGNIIDRIAITSGNIEEINEGCQYWLLTTPEDELKKIFNPHNK